MALLLREGHQVHLLTLTHGGATRVRHELGYSVEEMGQVRAGEMRDVERVLELTELEILDLPDSGLADMDPRRIESAVEQHIARVQPTVVVTYPVHGISGFFDHLVTHAVVKRVWVQMRDDGADYLRRLAFFTIPEEQAEAHGGIHRLKGSKTADIDCVREVSAEDVDKGRAALSCYKTYRQVVRDSQVESVLGGPFSFEFFGEHLSEPLDHLCSGLQDG
jgi:LmbE family N-acetylglucosaminyl deacetylase